jgi:hypothetical protein
MAARKSLCERCWHAMLIGSALAPVTVWGHGQVGKRYFPPTLAIEDPVVADEFTLRGSHIKEGGEGDEPKTTASEGEVELSKRVGRFAVTLGGSYVRLDPEGEDAEGGFGNFEVGARYQLYANPSREAAVVLGLEAEVGDTGSSDIGAESHSVITPNVQFGKGFGNWPWLGRHKHHIRPLALTGSFGANIPTDSRSEEGEDIPITVESGLALLYDFNYLQRETGIKLPAPLNGMIPVVEFTFETCVNRGCGGETTAFANPGVIWAGKYLQFGAEAQIPLNDRAGNNVGVLGLMNVSLHEFLPHSHRDLLSPHSSGP